ncbi:40S ribosomal protein S4, X isoform isoform X1 [Choloepus didactylus]|uniref:40S ribosomal protein S4, X isoform isoform X1 n=1 Tax=Choloepus didactylus TaxID=27675 RepID=UPI00189F7598|nr:40S ribosomal protein S4, X isoform isoform X1 [Choloepus didactylus]
MFCFVLFLNAFVLQAPHPSTGPHKLRECLPLIIFLRNRLKYALTGEEVKKICMQRFIKIDGKVRTDITYPAGFMDVISIDKTGENFRLVYDTKGRFAVHRITPEEAKYKLCKVRKIFVGTKGIPHLVTHDAHTIRYPDPLIKVNDTIQIDLETGKITDFIKFDTGNLCMVTGGANLGRIGVITNRERHPGSFDVVHVKDANGNSFATRFSNIFVIGKVSLGFPSLAQFILGVAAPGLLAQSAKVSTEPLWWGSHRTGLYQTCTFHYHSINRGPDHLGRKYQWWDKCTL